MSQRPAAATDAGGSLAHHHGVGRSKAPRLAAELGDGVEAVRALLRAFDPAGVLNPGNLVPREGGQPAMAQRAMDELPIAIDHESLLVRACGSVQISEVERLLESEGLSLAAPLAPPVSVADWLAQGAPGARDRWLDPADQVIAGLDGTLHGGLRIRLRPAPRRSVGPDLTALFVGAKHRFGRIDGAWLRVHRRGALLPESAAFVHERDPAPGEGERALLDAIERSLRV
jgi:alkyldihydroxyacetonephosphate synthase